MTLRILPARCKCPDCGIPTIEDLHDDLSYDERLCERCYATNYPVGHVAVAK